MTITTIEMTAERLRAVDDNEMQVYCTPGANFVYWDSRPSFAYDQCVATVTDFLDAVGYSDLDGIDDDEIFSLDVELVPPLTAPEPRFWDTVTPEARTAD